MRVKIYQINHERDDHGVKFMGLDRLDALQGNNQVDAAIYDEVFNAEAEVQTAEDAYRMFNTDGHPLFRGHSMSVSDVVVMQDKAYFCDSIGFAPISFDETETQKPDNLMRVVYVEPHKPAYIAEIEHTLEGEQKAVGGYIEPIYNDDDTCLVGNEEAKLIGLEGNRRFGDGTSIIAGPFFVCGLTEDDFRSLSDEEAETYLNKYSEPEDISQSEVQADMGFMIYGF